ncbi:hybrid sensor histidine kinase/response regulator [Niastella koreensis]|uniref:histidine kinase n=2 Tax=Niastella koreensis TaxID=354356 RepID=G8T8A4_NIAKG|nr:hybrid sensor histidine kinase/response regulator transcription factor [Niastella koreensis]AEV99074.1 histidine kinase [Niastella koreensis GR20-10]OQP43988.1 hybrid sensor histidine kinase/response regulator [Niastella koreensis]
MLPYLKLLIKTLVLLPACMCLVLLLSAQQPTAYHFAHLDFNQGLSNNQVNCIYKGKKGFLWFGTLSGLNRFDGYSFKTFRHSIKDSTSLIDDYIVKITAGPDNKLWINTRDGFNIYDPATESFDRRVDKYLQRRQLPAYGLTDVIPAGKGFLFAYRDLGVYYYENNKPAQLLTAHNNTRINVIADVKTDSKNNIWVVYCNGLIEQFDAITKAKHGGTNLLQQKQGVATSLYRLYIDSQDELWVYGSGIINGLYHITPQQNTLQQIANNEGMAILSSNIIMSMVEDDKGLLWIATDHGGLDILNKKGYTVQVLQNKPGDISSLAQNSLTELYKDDQGIIWVGTFKQGINYYHEGIIQFPLYRHDEADNTSLPYNDVNEFVEDGKGNLWIGTNGGGLLYYDRDAHTYKQIRHNPANDNSLCNDVIVSLFIDHANVLWIGTYFGGLDSYDGKTFTHHRHVAADTASLSDNRVWELYEDSNNDLWIGTLEAGLEKYDRANNQFIHYKPLAPNSVHTGYISSITEDKKGNLWVGTSYGIDVRNKQTGVFTQLLGRDTKLSNDNIISICIDSRGYTWVGTRDGLNVYNPKNNSFQVFRKEEGLPDNTILNILEDKSHDLWVSTLNGVSRISCFGTLQSGICISCLNYDRFDGLQGVAYNENAALKTRRGELIFGGPNGFNLFDPAKITINTTAPRVLLTGLQVFNQPIEVGDTIRNHVILQKAISETEAITLRYDENIFTLEFAALGFINNHKTRYAYRLKGFNDNWLYTDGNNRKATYTNLDPGKYTFYVKASDERGHWSVQEVAVTIVVQPPFWLSPLAYLLYVLMGLAILYFSRRFVIQQTKMRMALEQERKEASRMRELDLMKTRFFTNVSHEFRTPLSLILTPLEGMIKAAAEPAQQTQYQLIHRNARRLLNLVNQLLDFRKMEVHELKLHATEGDIIQFIEESAGSFTDIAEKKQIRFSYTADLKSLHTRFDHDKLERIIFNLLSNAFKFTAENGNVSVAVSTVIKESDTLLEIKVTDTGIGIPPNRHEKIFERFFQHDLPGTIMNQGSGIGLAITKEFVTLLGGAISVESEEGKGSTFMVVLPVKEITSSVDVMTVSDPNSVSPTNPVIPIPTIPTIPNISKIPVQTVLLVEDNEDFLFYLKDNLREYFNIAEAVNGREGWQKTLSVHPDIVVSDVNMPEMNGLELCKKIRQDPRTKHIPVVLLTAQNTEEQQLQGIETGAADYMTKPFNFEMLVSRIKNLLQQQQSMKQTFTKQVAVKTTDVELACPNERFVQEALTIVEKNIPNAGFSVEELSRALLLSRAAVYKRLFVLTGKTPIEFIRSVRLQRAAQLLAKSKMTVAEVAYETGFNNPKYFSKYFKAEFGKLPSAWQADAKKGGS